MKKWFCLFIAAGTMLSHNVFAELKSIESFTKGHVVERGLFDVYYDDDTSKVFLGIKQLNEEYILQFSLPYGLGSNDIGIDRGKLGDTKLIGFRRVGDAIFVVQKNTRYRALTDNMAERRAVEQAFAESVIARLPIVAKSNQNNSEQWLVDVSSWIADDLNGVARTIEQRKQGTYSLDKSLSTVDPTVLKSFPKNTELQSILTFSGKKPGAYLRSVSPDNQRFTLRQRVSLIALPDEQYQPRRFHPFSGFWSFSFLDYAAPITKTMDVKWIPRHRLKKKIPDAERSEAIEPIVYYVDNGAPQPIRQALIDGALWWNEAFEAAGFDNAFQVKVLPEGADMLDVRYNVIQWVHRSTRGWSYGASVQDPRTGEILKGHVTLGSLRVRQDLLIAKGVTAPYSNKLDTSSQAEKLDLATDMALARIRQLSAHEIGHTLGIAHNFAASANSRASVMDYPHPKFQLENGKVVLQDAYAEGIGAWDKQVVRYGYAEFSESEEQEQLKAIIQESKNLGLQFISDSDARSKSGAHPTAHLWDNGEDAADELTRIIKIRQTAIANFSAGVVNDGVPYSEIEEVLVPVYNLHRYQVEAASKLIGGVNYQYAVKGEDDFVLENVNATVQKKAFDSLLATLSPEFLEVDARIVELIPPKAYGYSRSRESFASKTGLTFDPLSAAEGSASHTLSLLLNAERISRVIQQSPNELSARKMLALLTQRILIDAFTSQQQLPLKLRVAEQYIIHLHKLVNTRTSAIESTAVVLFEIESIQDWIKKELGRTRKSDDRYIALKGLNYLLKVSAEQTPMERKPAVLPPGSPIGSEH